MCWRRSSPLACGTLAQIYCWHYGFALAGVMMLVAAAVYFAGMRHFPDHRVKLTDGPAPKLTGNDWRMIGLIGLRSEEPTSALQSLMRISYAVFCLKKKKQTYHIDCTS